MPLLARKIDGWTKDVFVQISESMTGRALRTPEWAYVVAEPDGKSHASSAQYEEYQLYNLLSDPHELVNLAGRRETREISTTLRDRLTRKMREVGEAAPEITPKPLYP
jgi:arylsulfatase A-like enzyme